MISCFEFKQTIGSVAIFLLQNTNLGAREFLVDCICLFFDCVVIPCDSVSKANCVILLFFQNSNLGVASILVDL